MMNFVFQDSIERTDVEGAITAALGCLCCTTHLIATVDRTYAELVRSVAVVPKDGVTSHTWIDQLGVRRAFLVKRKRGDGGRFSLEAKAVSCEAMAVLTTETLELQDLSYAALKIEARSHKDRPDVWARDVKLYGMSVNGVLWNMPKCPGGKRVAGIFAQRMRNSADRVLYGLSTSDQEFVELAQLHTRILKLAS